MSGNGDGLKNVRISFGGSTKVRRPCDMISRGRNQFVKRQSAQ